MRNNNVKLGYDRVNIKHKSLITGLILGLVALSPNVARAQSVPSAVFNARWWSAGSFWNTPIGTATVEPISAKVISSYVALNKGMNMNWDSAGVAVIYSDGVSDPAADISFLNYPNRLWKFPSVPQSAALISAVNYRLQQKNTDGMTCLYDDKLQGFYSFWQPVVNADAKTISITTGAFNRIDGMGGSSVDQFTPSGGRAAGTSYCGGLIRPEEIEAGVINHALALDWPNNLTLSQSAANKAGIQVRVYPATNSDGTSTGTTGIIPMGSRLQLDPTLSDFQLQSMGLTKPADLVIAHALQTYGAYDVDSNSPNANAGLYFQSGFGNGANIYQATNPWPVAVISHMSVVAGPAPTAPLDTAASVSLPIPSP
jgi:hypothetical protein